MQSGFPSSPYSFGRPAWQRRSLVTLLIIANILAFVLQHLFVLFRPELEGFLYGTLALSRDGIARGFYWQFLSYMFLHGGVFHLLVNCLGLYFAGREVESIFGPAKFLLIYFLGGVLGGVAQLIAGPGTIEIIGASGGVCAVLLAFTTALPELEITALLFFIIPLKMKAKWLGWGVIATSVAFQLFADGHDPVAHVAHLGGALTGWACARGFGYGGSFWLQRWMRDREQTRRRHDEMSPKEFISAEIDPILDKIARDGIHSLTRSERRILEKGRDKIANRSK